MPKLPHHYERFVAAFPEVGEAHKRLSEAAMASGPLDPKTAELIKVGFSAGARMESAVKSHARRALSAGASHEEIVHAVLLGVTTVGFPTMMATLSWVQDVLEADSCAAR
jgi:AhpD family alkylhydroperoxidase